MGHYDIRSARRKDFVGLLCIVLFRLRLSDIASKGKVGVV